MIVHDVTKQQRQRLIHTMRHLTMTVTGVRGFNEAIITQEGIRVKGTQYDGIEACEGGCILPVDPGSGCGYRRL